jgi:threonine dehydrogenase-like Zn-dependent dehydrogenase
MATTKTLLVATTTSTLKLGYMHYQVASASRRGLAAGAAPIVVTNLDENRLAKARSLIPRFLTVLVERGVDAANLGNKILDTLGQEARLVLECAGVESSIP